MRYRLRYQHRELDLPEGEFAIGRQATCDLTLEDPLVSRQHAVIRVRGSVVTVADNGSRNGVLVNGTRGEGEVVLKSGDVLLIGSQEMVFIADDKKSSNFLKRTLPRIVSAPVVPNIASDDNDSMSRMATAESRALGHDEGPPGDGNDLSIVRKIETFTLIGGVAEKALAMGKAQDAERMLGPPLADILDSVRQGRRVTATLVDSAARLAAKLASATGKGSWADHVVELYVHQQRPFPAPVVEELSSALRRVTNFDIAKFRSYLETLRKRSSMLTPADRFLLQRIEGLERIASLR